MIKNNLNFDVIIFCGGKCGGTTLATTFKNNNFDVAHLHSSKVKGNFISNFDINNTFKIIDNNSINKTIYLIDVYRTPIERKISAFFQNIMITIPSYKDKTINELIDYFNKNLLFTIAENHSINELFDHYDIQKWDTFNFKKGYNRVEHKNKVFIKLLYSNINSWQEQLTEIMGRKIVIYSKNKSSDKDYYKIYRNFLSNYKVPKKYLDHLRNEKEFQLYNTITEQETYLKEWDKKSF
jgi:hypothetical protein